MSKIEKNIKNYIVGKPEYTCRREEWKRRKVMDIPGRHERKKKKAKLKMRILRFMHFI